MTAPLPRLIDSRGAQAETGLKRGVIDSLFRELDKYRIGRRVYVHRDELLAALERRRLNADGFPKGRAA